ncbi:hypothetical protein [Mariprofundus ferrooxydans]|uniref:hypothetical protein n=1 Tax=Mariprofundus ferrooxydans TaxID=314344 RepID=UPI00143144B4|nr:hypothetical protein [Mariprofundus ferrooxydans]
MLKHIIPDSIPDSDRAEQLEKARTSMQQHAVIMQHTARRGDLGAFRHARRMYEQSVRNVAAWQAAQRAPAQDVLA